MSGGLPSTAQVTRDLERAGTVTVELPAAAAFAAVAQIQLALRHPANMGAAAELSVVCAEALTLELPASAQEMIRLGWDPANDREIMS